MPAQEAEWPKCQLKAGGQIRGPLSSCSFLDVDSPGATGQGIQDQSLDTTLGL